MRIGIRLVALVAVGSAFAAACSSFSASDDAAPAGEEGGVDAAAADTSISDAADTSIPDAVDPGPNLAVNGGFQEGCAGWEISPNAGGSALSDGNRTPGSCQICSTGGGAFSVGQTIKHPLARGAEVHVVAWVKLTEAGAATGPIEPVIRTFDAKGSMLEQGDNGAVAVGGTFVAAYGIMELTKDLDNLIVSFGTNNAAPVGSCFVIDDAAITTTP